MHFNQSSFFSYNPVTNAACRETFAINAALKRRYFLVQKAKAASCVGVVVGTAGQVDTVKTISAIKL